MILKLPADQSVTLEQRILFLRSENSLRFNSRTMEEFLKRVGMTHSGVYYSHSCQVGRRRTAES